MALIQDPKIIEAFIEAQMRKHQPKEPDMKRGELLGKMIVLATNAHAGQFDKSGEPYILHVLEVLHGVRHLDEETQCIAVGHDLFEDTDTTVEDVIELGATDRVVRGILDLTKQNGESYNTYKKKVMGNRDAMIVKQSDLKHNSDIRRLKGITEKDIRRMAKYMAFYTEIEAELNK
jgi:guanosine-3',5'-bis(diphosphate) 3'-pyrophosphohydrolase